MEEVAEVAIKQVNRSPILMQGDIMTHLFVKSLTADQELHLSGSYVNTTSQI